MANSSLTSWFNLDQFIGGVAIIIAGAIGSLVRWFINRGKAKPEINAIEAGAEKDRASARHLDGQTIAQAYDRINELWDENERLTVEVRRLMREAADVHLLEYEVKWMHAVLTTAGVKLSDYDHLRRKKES